LLLDNILLDHLVTVKGSAALQCNPSFARDTFVPVPDLFRLMNNEKPTERKKTSKDKNASVWTKMFEANQIPTRLVLMEERNVYCGPYNVLLLKDE
jgi:F-box and WD-40 domain protein 10